MHFNIYAMKHLKLFEHSSNLELNYCNAGYGQIFWDQDNNIICGIHENDGELREEYMNVIFNHFGIQVTYHKEIPDFIRNWDTFSDYGY